MGGILVEVQVEVVGNLVGFRVVYASRAALSACWARLCQYSSSSAM